MFLSSVASTLSGLSLAGSTARAVTTNAESATVSEPIALRDMLPTYSVVPDEYETVLDLDIRWDSIPYEPRVDDHLWYRQEGRYFVIQPEEDTLTYPIADIRLSDAILETRLFVPIDDDGPRPDLAADLHELRAREHLGEEEHVVVSSWSDAEVWDAPYRGYRHTALWGKGPMRSGKATSKEILAHLEVAYHLRTTDWGVIEVIANQKINPRSDQQFRLVKRVLDYVLRRNEAADGTPDITGPTEIQ
jgi:hypothetical protein